MTLRELLETTSLFQKVDVVYDQEHRTGTSLNLLSSLGLSYLDSPVVEIKADKFGELLVAIDD
ncbi:MAG: hypothetical protein J6Y26_06655 [Lachnospiraceae bacterium]|nr:hypothetical protein [Lachnospiraceae bacterium]